MSVRQTNGIEVECPNGHRIVIPKEDWDFGIDEVENKSEHGMGGEINHRYSVSGYRCPQCDREIDANVDVWEYPSGAIETIGKSPNVVGDVKGSFVAELD